MKTKLQRTILIVSIATFCTGTIANAQNVTISDANFKAALVGNASINTNADSEIQVSEASVFTGTINVSNSSISNLTGIGSFTALRGLNCNFNSLTALNLSVNTALNYLDCSANQLTGLNISTNSALTVLNCAGNQITSLNVSANTAITRLNCSYNQLASLAISSNTALTLLDCNDNQLTNLDASANTSLTYLQCNSNQLTNLNISSNTSLSTLFCSYNQLANLDVSACPSLSLLMCSQNQLVSLDLSGNTALAGLNCSGNQLTYLNIKNGNNTNLFDLDVTNNIVNYCCIQVDDVAYANANPNWYIDLTASYSTNCSVGIEKYTLVNEITIYPNPNNGIFTIKNSGQFGLKTEINNVIGEKIYSTDNNKEEVYNMDISNAAKGIYFVKIIDGNNNVTSRKIIVQ